jgi:CheY-like chemotaxis protein
MDREFHNILIVDDDEDTRVMMKELIHLYDREIEVLLAENGEVALQAMRDHHPDLVLLDVVMPGVSGWEVLALKQRDEQFQGISVIMVSAQDMQSDMPHSPFLLTSIGDGVSVGKLVESLSFLPKLMLSPG